MMTLDFLKTTNSFERQIPQPLAFQPNGYYPTMLRLVKHNGITEIILEKFKLR